MPATRLHQESAIIGLGLIPAACVGLGLLFAPPAIAQPAAGVAAMVSFDVLPPPARRCTCKDIEDLVDNLHGGVPSSTHFRDLERRLAAREQQGLSVRDSQTEWEAAQKAFRIPIRDPGAGGGVSAATLAASETDILTCRTTIPPANLTRFCDGIIQVMWEHERVHRDLCQSLKRAGTSGHAMPGSHHAGEEAAAYEKGNAILRLEIERVLEESKLAVRATTLASLAAPMSHQDSKFLIDLKPQGASGDGVVEFTGKGHTRYTKLRHGNCVARPLDQALTLSVRTQDMQNFTVIHQPGGPQTARYTCPRPWTTVDLPLLTGFGKRWVQPIRRQRPFPYGALAFAGGGSDGGFPGLPPGMSLPNMGGDGGFPGLPTAPDGGVTPPAGAPGLPDGGLPNLSPSQMPFGILDTMVTLSCN